MTIISGALTARENAVKLDLSHGYGEQSHPLVLYDPEVKDPGTNRVFISVVGV